MSVVGTKPGQGRPWSIGTVLRVSLTDRCNFQCRYCGPPGGVARTERGELLPLDRLSDMVTWLHTEIGLTRIKLTGGEPLIRVGVAAFVRTLAAIPGIAEVSATTNGSLLARQARELKLAGLSRVNISIDSLDPDRFDRLTNGGRLSDTLDGVDAAIAAGLTPVKLNAVLMASSWRDDVPALLDYAASLDTEVRFIELMRTGTDAGWADREYVSADVVRTWLGARRGMRDDFGGSPGPARRTRMEWSGATVRVGWITPRSNPFCADCNRLRLDGRGMVHRCLMDPEPFALDHQLRAVGEDEVRRGFHAYLKRKIEAASMESRLPMLSMGG